MLIDVIGAALMATAMPPAPAIPHESDPIVPQGPVVETADVALFYRVYDAAGGRPTAEQLQGDYLDQGSPGLKHFARIRNITGARIALAIDERPEIYVEARRCAAVLPAARDRAAGALERFSAMLPEARFPAVTISVGRGRPVAVARPTRGINIGLEALCATDFINPDLEDRLVRVMVHEFVHTQQTPELADKAQYTVLEASLAEGVAEFVTELMTGDVAYAYMADLVRGREAEIETAFVEDMKKTELSDWVWNSTPEDPADLGYWVGYRIAKTFYDRAADKPEALRAILAITDASEFLASSGWRPAQPD